jgi:hypothetical protein
MADSNRSFRSSQLISPFGPGAIIDIGDESLIMMDTNHWPEWLEEIKLDRLTRECGVWALRKPPVVKQRWENVHKNNALMTYRFPRWMFCPKCRKLSSWKREGETNDDGAPICTNPKCKKRTLVPMRFVAACNKGHLQDVNWSWWAHKRSKPCDSAKDNLRFKSDPSKGSGLDALYVECGNCGAANYLGELMHAGALGKSCQGKQPWEYDETESKCDESLQVLQRGASNLYYPIVRSALDIPLNELTRGNPVLDAIIDLDDYKELLKAIQDGKEKKIYRRAEDLADEIDELYSADEIIAAVNSNQEETREFKIPKDEDLRLAEWDVLSAPNPEQYLSETYKARLPKNHGEKTFGIDNVLKRIVLLDKLREVRVFCGFERVKPDGSAVEMKDRRTKKSWLPACEVFGEGIFIEFDQEAISKWEIESSDFVQPRIQALTKRQAKATSTYLPTASATFVTLHTFAHLLIRQLSFESGYSSGSLRERIYADDGQAGVLIYTADGDSEGSLGGLVQQGETNRIYPAIVAALETANWCSNDPVCSELESQGVMGLNKAACHSCTLISETSCENNNLLLDRKLLLGDGVGNGLFTEVMADIAMENEL